MSAADAPLRATHVIPSLDVGGAELVLERLAEGLAGRGIVSDVVCMGERGRIGERLAAGGIDVVSLGLRPVRPRLGPLRQLVEHLGRRRPDIVQTWMYHADLVGGVAARLSGHSPAVVWGVHNTDLRSGRSKRNTRAVARFNERLATRLPDAIVCCAEAARSHHVARGYPPDRTLVIHNGFDPVTVDADRARALMVRRLRLPSTACIVGRAGRFDPQKDHLTLLRAMARVVQDRPDVHLALCGTGMDAHNQQLRRWVDACSLQDRVHLLGVVDEMATFNAGIDIAVSSSSYGEAFPAAVGEAMAAGTPVVATDVGDAAAIVGRTGVVVPPEDPVALARALKQLIDLGMAPRADLGRRAMERIQQQYPRDETLSAYRRLYTDLAAQRPIR